MITFQSKYYDTELGLYYYYHRYYYPKTGRFTTEDPIGISGGLNLYRAFGNNPVNFVDPFGEDVWIGTYSAYNISIFVVGYTKGTVELRNINTGEVCKGKIKGSIFKKLGIGKIGIGFDLSIETGFLQIIGGPKKGKYLNGISVILSGSYDRYSVGVGFADNGVSINEATSIGISIWFGTGVVNMEGLKCCKTEK